jgi:hypothetical protein
LEGTLDRFDKTLGQWPKTRALEELGGALTEHDRLLKGTSGKQILDSKHFHDLRALLKKEVLEKKKYRPGTEPYAMMLEVLGYSTDEKQKVILTLPFISPDLAGMYKEPVFEAGPFFKLVPTNLSHGAEGIEKKSQIVR